MLRNCVIFSLFIAAIHATGEFTVLNSPKSISFKGNDALESHEIDEVLLAAMGNPITDNSKFGGVVIQDPFNMAKGIIAVHVQGINHLATASNAKTFDLVGSRTTSSLNALAAELEANNEPVCDLKYDQDADQTFKTYFGDVAIVPAKPTKHLNPSLHNADKQFLEFVGLITGAAENLADMSKPSNVIILRVSLDGIAKAHGVKSEAVEEAQKILSAAVNRLLAAAQKSMDSVLVVQIAEKESINARTKRDTLAGSQDNTFNLATYYNSDYPVIFNIILWFMVVFGFSLLAICYAIGSMDPGRDSIIYRMTSTRMKKDN